MTNKTPQPTLLQALIPIVFLIVFLATNVFIFGDDSLEGSNQLVLLLSAAAAALVAFSIGVKWQTMLDGVVKSISSALPALIILLLIGSLAGTWLLSGIVPAMIYYGLQILNPTIFLFAACVVCAIVSLATGSSWSTVATVGIALLGIGKVLGLSEGIIAGAIISGAYFGDKMSPLSDTTNLAPAMAGAKLFDHIKYMAWTTIPSITITLILFLVIGLTSSTSADVSDVEQLLAAIDSKFNINGWLFIVPLAVIFMIVRKVPAIPALLAGTLLGGLFALIFQPEIIKQVSGISDNFLKASYVAIMDAMSRKISITTENDIVNDLLSTNGMYGMMKTIWLIICAMCFGGIMEASGLLQRITQSVIKLARSTGSLIATTTCTCIFFNVTASDQYLSIVVPGRMFASTFRKRGLKPVNLSRTLEDSGTVTSVLVPWNTCGATQSSVLGVATGEYFIYCFFNLISPVMTMIFGFAGIKIAKLQEKDIDESNPTTNT